MRIIDVQVTSEKTVLHVGFQGKVDNVELMDAGGK
jgi:hypothetical protein